jgi:hypothetical protein
MPDMHLFEYAVIRIVPRVEREEFINAGVILFCPGKKFLDTRIHCEDSRLILFVTDEAQRREIDGYLRAFRQIAAGGPDSGPIGRLPDAGRFRWLTAIRSTMLQTSRVHSGLCEDPVETLGNLFQQLIL